MKLLFFDLETTGTKPGINGIHQISGAVVIDGVTKEKFNLHIQPHNDAVIEQSALDVAGVTIEQIMSYPPMAEVFSKFISILSKYVDRYDKTDKFYLVGYNNGPFDNPFLRVWFGLNGDKYFGSWFWPNCIDVMVMATPYLADHRSQMLNFKQGTVAKTLGIPVDDSKLHNALYDIDICKAIYDIVVAKY